MTLEAASKVYRECLMTGDVLLRDVTEGDLPILFDQQRDPAANRMAAFTAKDPADRAAFAAKWAKILADESCLCRSAAPPALPSLGLRKRSPSPNASTTAGSSR